MKKEEITKHDHRLILSSMVVFFYPNVIIIQHRERC
jgi:hypothetical protein